MSLAASESQLSLWALGSAPLILGSDLTTAVTNAYGTSAGITARDLRLLTNRQVIRVDQDAIDASRIADVGSPGSTAGDQVFAKVERGGDAIAGLFNTTTALSSAPVTVSTGSRRERRRGGQQLHVSIRNRLATERAPRRQPRPRTLRVSAEHSTEYPGVTKMKKILAAIASVAAAGFMITTAAAGAASAATATTGVGIQLLDGSAPNPSYMQASIPRGGSKTWHVKITNTGTATETVADLPTSALTIFGGGLAGQPTSTLQSWITESQTTAVVAAGQSTTIAVTVTVPATAPLGAVAGSAPGVPSLAVNTFWGYAYPAGGQIQIGAAAGIRMYITVTPAS